MPSRFGVAAINQTVGTPTDNKMRCFVLPINLVKLRLRRYVRHVSGWNGFRYRKGLAAAIFVVGLISTRYAW